MYRVEIIRNTIRVNGGEEFILGDVTCKIAAGETDWIDNPKSVLTNWNIVRDRANEYLESCFYSNDITDKTKGYIFRRASYFPSGKKYTLEKIFNEIEYEGKTKLQVIDCYEADNLLELIDLEMMYAVQNNIAIFMCKNCGKYFATLNAGAVYCNRIFSKGQTCKYYGAKKTAAETLKNNEIIALYEKTCQAIYYKKRTASDKKEANRLDTVVKNLRKQRLEYKRGNLSDEKFRNIIEEHIVKKTK